MNLCFYLVRHGIKEKAIGDVSITPAGIKQAQETAKYFSKIPIEAILSSPLRRAQETAHYIASETNTKVLTDDRLRERANWGDLPGQSFDEFVEMWERCTRDPDFLPPIGDSARQASERLSSLLKDFAHQFPSGSHIVLVTHGGLITDYLTNTFDQSILNEFYPNFVVEQSSLVSECSITKINYGIDFLNLQEFASVEHLNKN
ncbi:histidine phosphatase family protein [Saccharibacillus sp. JS10]|uniref:histidine phosphatase family protein n=1 Tax=Saccharibacillus sp. JS10 TaxID=2950552 RepID=UPI00210E1BE0|nr:histidine phosphatase family protein [Saccharibacillus sp. JS10]